MLTFLFYKSRTDSQAQSAPIPSLTQKLLSKNSFQQQNKKKTNAELALADRKQNPPNRVPPACQPPIPLRNAAAESESSPPPRQVHGQRRKRRGPRGQNQEKRAVRTSCEVQRSGLASGRVASVDRLGGDELLDARQVAGLAGLEELAQRIRGSGAGAARAQGLRARQDRSSSCHFTPPFSRDWPDIRGARPSRTVIRACSSGCLFPHCARPPLILSLSLAPAPNGEPLVPSFSRASVVLSALQALLLGRYCYYALRFVRIN